MHLVAFKGLAGTGKTTLSRALGSRLGWPVIDKDEIHDALGDDNSHSPLAYTLMFAVIESLLGQRLSVICDSPLRGEESFANLRRVAQEAGARLWIAECRTLDEAVWQTRFEARTGLPPRRLTDWTAFQPHLAAARRDMIYDIPVPHLIVNTDCPVEKSLQRVLQWLNSEQIDVRSS